MAAIVAFLTALGAALGAGSFQGAAAVDAFFFLTFLLSFATALLAFASVVRVVGTEELSGIFLAMLIAIFTFAATLISGVVVMFATDEEFTFHA